MTPYPKAFLELCASITDKRPKTVIDHILKHGHVTTEELKSRYGYNHPPRAARDVREKGIRLETFRVAGSDGRKIGAYRFADPSATALRRRDGRTGLSKEIKDALIAKYGCKCFIYLETVEERELQIDHRVPYEVAGDAEESEPEKYMLLCGSANRAKSWACEHCANWIGAKDETVCASCYWAYPEKYTHIGMREVRRADIMWQGKEVVQYDRLREEAATYGEAIPQVVKRIIDRALR